MDHKGHKGARNNSSNFASNSLFPWRALRHKLAVSSFKRWRAKLAITLAVAAAIGLVVTLSQRSSQSAPPAAVAPERPSTPETVDRLRKVAAMGSPAQRHAIERRLPLVYAHAGEKVAALAALDAVEANPELVKLRDDEARADSEIRGFDFANCTPDLFARQAPDSRPVRRLRILVTIIDAQMRLKDKAGAARTADELYQTLTNVQGFMLPENQRCVDLTVDGFLRAERPIPAAIVPLFRRADHNEQFFMLFVAAAYRASKGDADAADQLMASIPELSKRIMAYEQTASAREAAGDKATAGRFYKTALGLLQQAPLGGPSGAAGDLGSILLGCRLNGAAGAADDWLKGLTIPEASAAANLIGGSALGKANNMDFPASAQLYAMVSQMSPGASVAQDFFQHAANSATRALDAGDSKTTASIESSVTKIFNGTRGGDVNLLVVCRELLPLQKRVGDRAGMAVTARRAAEFIDHDTAANGPGATPLDRIKTLVEVAGMQLDAGNAEASKKLLRQAMALWPALDSSSDPTRECIVKIAVAARESGDAAGSVEAFRLARASIGSLPLGEHPVEEFRAASLCVVAEGRARQGDFKEAEQILGQLPLNQSTGALVPTPEMAWAELGRSQWAKGDKQAAQHSFDKSVACCLAVSGGTRQIAGVGRAAAEIGRAGDIAGALALLARYDKLAPRPTDLYALAEAQVRAGDTVGGAKTYARAEQIDPLVNEQISMVLRLMNEGDYRRGLDLAAHLPHSIDSQVLQAAADAGEVDFVVGHMSDQNAVGFAAARLDADDPAGAARILRRGLDAEWTAAWRQDKVSRLSMLVTGLVAAGDKAGARAALGRLRPPFFSDPATRPAGRPASRPSDHVLQYWDLLAEKELTRAQVLCGDIDGALEWIETRGDWATRLADVNGAVEAIMYAWDPTWSSKSLLPNLDSQSLPRHVTKKKRPATAAS